jgi:hypothetical protein
LQGHILSTGALFLKQTWFLHIWVALKKLCRAETLHWNSIWMTKTPTRRSIWKVQVLLGESLIRWERTLLDSLKCTKAKPTFWREWNQYNFTISFQLSNKLSSSSKDIVTWILHQNVDRWLLFMCRWRPLALPHLPTSNMKTKRQIVALKWKMFNPTWKHELHMQQMSTIISKRIISN